MQKDIERIADHFGMKDQQNKAIEEFTELIEAITKMQTEEFKVDHYINLIEEIGDVEIMIAQIKHLNEIDESSVEEVKKEKIQRTIERYKID